jgi:hypothetical protein
MLASLCLLRKQISPSPARAQRGRTIADLGRRLNALSWVRGADKRGSTTMAIWREVARCAA